MRLFNYIAIASSVLVAASWLVSGCSEAATNCDNLGTCAAGGSTSASDGGGGMASEASSGTGTPPCAETSSCSNGTPCANGNDCESGSCADGVCCDTACDTTCVSCSQGELSGVCSPYPAGKDPESECSSKMCNGLWGCVQRHCADILDPKRQTPDGIYRINPGGPNSDQPFDAYCNMTDHGGGWTLAMKVDGTTNTLMYNSSYWDDMELLKPESIDIAVEEDAKLEPALAVEFTRVMVGMRASDGSSEMSYRVLDLGAESLRDLFKGNFTGTGIGREAWLSMVPGMQIQGYCDREGVNVEAGSTRVRLGMAGNDYDNCDYGNSYVGLGGQYNSNMNCASSLPRPAAGSFSCEGPTATAPAFGVIFVR